MKKYLIIGLTLLMGVVMETSAQNNAGGGKVLIAYFSWSGNTRTIAQEIQKATGGELFEIKTVDAYPTDYKTVVNQAKKEQQENARPALVAKVNNMDSYDTIIIGYPNWWGTIPMAVFTFLEAYDFDGKTIIPFCTNEGSGLGRSASDIKKTAPKATVRDGLAIRGGSVKSATNEVTAWLKKSGMIK
ncbi:MAG: NAD(P)H-dependent oxidoreductase [Spirochaetaceae bacterium]|jgi:flavodoxin|nr:NAD(P)H-dependent oxidoreductase [Spirochaetaceae bacterium]